MARSSCLRFLIVIGGLVFLGTPLAAQVTGYTERELFLPWREARPNGLDALLVYANHPGKHPLIVITHGSARDPSQHAEVTPWQELPQAIWFARRGWVSLVVVRRGYGLSSGTPDTEFAGRSRQRGYERAGLYSAQDLAVAILYGRSLPEVDPKTIIVAGVSTGGFATVALTTAPPPGVVAAINFSGGRGSRDDYDVANPASLISAFQAFGTRSRVPMLWLYSENDKFFWPDLSRAFDSEFRSGGGQDQFILLPPVGKDGHSLFRHPEAWSTAVDHFLQERHLTILAEPLPEPIPPKVNPPAGLDPKCLDEFNRYVLAIPHKAFAMSEHFCGYAAGAVTPDAARKKALANWRRAAKGKEKGVVVSVDGADLSEKPPLK